MRKISPLDLLNHHSAIEVASGLPHHNQSLFFYSVLLDKGVECYLSDSCRLIVIRDPKVHLDLATSREWTKKDFLKLKSDLALPNDIISVYYYSPSEKWIEGLPLIEETKLKWTTLNLGDGYLENLDRRLKNHIKKTSAHVGKLTIAPYTKELWEQDMIQLHKFHQLKNIPTDIPQTLKSLFNNVSTIPQNIHRVELETAYGPQMGVVSKWKDIWTADYNWSFARFKSGLNFTTIFHSKLIEEAIKQGMSHYSLGFLSNQDAGLIQYKGLWKPDISYSFRVKLGL